MCTDNFGGQAFTSCLLVTTETGVIFVIEQSIILIQMHRKLLPVLGVSDHYAHMQGYGRLSTE